MKNVKTASQSIYGLDDRNVLFITLDCCRADTFELANLPYLKSLGQAVRAQTAGTFTLPAHMAFFGGYLPINRTSKEPYYNPNIRQLWRLQSGRSRNLDTVGIMLDGNNVLEGYRNLGFHTLGLGGVRWFRNTLLTNLFDEFHFFGPDDTTSVFASRRPEDLVLNHLDEIETFIKNKDRFFLFINSIETHVPYDNGVSENSDELKDIMQRAQNIWGCKTPSVDNVQVTKEELKSLHQLQIRALESIDSKVKDLVSRLPKPLLVVISGDHGECFGENLQWGHGYPNQKVSEVPLLIACID